MISEGSCDTEDWSNDDENPALSSQEQITFLTIFIQKTILNHYNILSYSC